MLPTMGGRRSGNSSGPRSRLATSRRAIERDAGAMVCDEGKTICGRGTDEETPQAGIGIHAGIGTRRTARGLRYQHQPADDLRLLSSHSSGTGSCTEGKAKAKGKGKAKGTAKGTAAGPELLLVATTRGQPQSGLQRLQRPMASGSGLHQGRRHLCRPLLPPHQAFLQFRKFRLRQRWVR